MAVQFVWQNYHKLLLTDYISKKGNIQQGENEALEWIIGFLEEHR
ncbi:30617_t:CDS:1, partial [Gigaspora margarita]